MAVDVDDVAGAEHQRFIDVAKAHARFQLAGAYRQHRRPQQIDGHRHEETETAPGKVLYAVGAPQRHDALGDDIESHAAPADRIGSFGRRKAGLEEILQQLAFRQGIRFGSRGQVVAYQGFADTRAVDAFTVVFDAHGCACGAGADGDLHGADGLFAASHPALRCFDAVRDGIFHELDERLHQAIQDTLADFNVAAAHLQLDPLALRQSRVAHEARHACEDSLHGQHPEAGETVPQFLERTRAPQVALGNAVEQDARLIAAFPGDADGALQCGGAALRIVMRAYSVDRVEHGVEDGGEIFQLLFFADVFA